MIHRFASGFTAISITAVMALAYVASTPEILHGRAALLLGGNSGCLGTTNGTCGGGTDSSGNPCSATVAAWCEPGAQNNGYCKMEPLSNPCSLAGNFCVFTVPEWCMGGQE
jgi:hypothetical protein